MPTRGELRLLLNGSYSYVCTLRELCPTRREYVVDLERVPESVSMIVEDSMLLALIRRFLIRIIPQDYVCTINNVPVCSFRQHFNPFIFKITMDFLPGEKGLLDRRLAFAAGVLLGAIEGRQD